MSLVEIYQNYIASRMFYFCFIKEYQHEIHSPSCLPLFRTPLGREYSGFSGVVMIRAREKEEVIYRKDKDCQGYLWVVLTHITFYFY
jgi:hypothetical protein